MLSQRIEAKLAQLEALQAEVARLEALENRVGEAIQSLRGVFSEVSGDEEILGLLRSELTQLMGLESEEEEVQPVDYFPEEEEAPEEEELPEEAYLAVDVDGQSFVSLVEPDLEEEEEESQVSDFQEVGQDVYFCSDVTPAVILCLNNRDRATKWGQWLSTEGFGESFVEENDILLGNRTYLLRVEGATEVLAEQLAKTEIDFLLKEPSYYGEELRTLLAPEKPQEATIVEPMIESEWKPTPGEIFKTRQGNKYKALEINEGGLVLAEVQEHAVIELEGETFEVSIDDCLPLSEDDIELTLSPQNSKLGNGMKVKIHSMRDISSIHDGKTGTIVAFDPSPQVIGCAVRMDESGITSHILKEELEVLEVPAAVG